MNEIYLSIIVPAYNEETYIRKSLKKIIAYLKKKGISYEILVVDDGSQDKTRQVVRAVAKKNKNIRLLWNRVNLGKGGAIKKGALAARGRYILFTDVDLSAPIEQFERFEKWLKKGYDMVIGSRRLSDSQVKIDQPFLRQFLGHCFYFLVHLFILREISDTNCGFKAYKRKTARKIFQKQRLLGWGFDTELLYIAKKLNYKIREEPVVWYNSGASRVRIGKAVVDTLKELLMIKINDFLGHYE